MNRLRMLCISIAIAMLSGCENSDDKTTLTELKVVATAYTSTHSQTDDTPFLAAWNNQLEPGMKAIAVSRDLLDMGLQNGSVVTISGLPGEYLVLDKMHKRWQNKIDIYMGLDHDAAKEWGKQEVVISWNNSNE